MIPLGVLAQRQFVAGSFAYTGFGYSGDSYGGSPGSSNTLTVPIGAYSAGRTVVLAAWHGILSTDAGLSVTVDGVSATEDYEYGGALSNRHNIGIYRAANPTGSTCEVTLNTGGSAFTVVYAWTYPGPLTFGAAGGTYSAGGSPSRSVTLPSGGFAAAIASHRDTTSDAATWSWTGATLADPGPWTSAATITADGTITAASGLAVSTALVTATYSPA